ncbi:Replicative DNA helicase [bioreactor metagenome]|uniref:Replicative DNA helicase n=1 Tax=bioreactor metagenome TaxID=1076179 RepID=A0A645CDT7_9ZZZZ
MFLAQLHGDVPTTVNVRDWVTMLREYHGRRELIRISMRAIDRFHDTEYPVLSGFKELSDSVNASEDFLIRSKSLPTAAQGEQYLETLNQIQCSDGKGNGVIIPWGIAGLDDLCPFQRQQVFVLGAGVNTGKTRFILSDLAGKLTMPEPPPVVIFSRENSNRVLWDGLVSIVSGVSGYDLNRPGGLDAQKSEAVQNAVRFLQSKADFFRLYGKGQYKPTPSGIGAKVRHVWNFTKGKLAMVAIDYIQNHRPDGKAFGRTDEIERFMGELSEELEEFPIAELLLSQLNRDKERGNRANTVADLKGSSSIEQEADYIAFLQKDTKKSFGCYEVDYYAVKTRSGTPRWNEKLSFNSATGKFIGLASRYSAADCPGNY